MRHNLFISLFLLAACGGPDSTPVEESDAGTDMADASDASDVTHEAGDPDAVGTDTPDTADGQDTETDLPEDLGPLPSDNDPGRVTLHRLNRTEYNNTLRDLLGTQLRPADGFPLDDSGFGFDNNADVLSVSPSFVELHERAVEAALDDALAPTLAPSLATRYEAELLGAENGERQDEESWIVPRGAFSFRHRFPHAARYAVRSRLSANIDFFQPVLVSIRVDGEEVGVHEVWEEYPEFGPFELEIEVTAGDHDIDFFFLNPNFQEGDNRDLIVDHIEIDGPLDLRLEDSERRHQILFCDLAEEGCTRRVLTRFARRAWRRPATEREIDALMGVVVAAMGAGDGPEMSVRLGLITTLMSPWFLYRVEIDPDPTSEEPHPLTDHELASRLSYFLWSSMPDEALLDAADRRALSSQAEYAAQIERMLADPKAVALLDNFAGQWLSIRSLDEVEPNPDVFPDFDGALRGAFRDETRAFFWDLLQDDVPITQLLIADYTHLNDRLATHYGIDGRFGAELARTEVDTRGGILTHGTFLTATSHADRTSAVKRGKWVLGQLLCDEPPAPPPGVEDLPTREQVDGTLRERMAAHIVDPSCAECHKSMDPIGFALENYDGVGAWRFDEDGRPIDATGELPTGETFEGAFELAEVLAEDERLAACIVKQVTTYALGRGTEWYDAADLEATEIQWRRGGLRLRDLLRLVVMTDAFTMRRGEPEP